MKTFFKTFAPMALAVACGAVLLTNVARAEDEPLPPEVKKLIGMKIPPVIVGKQPGYIPNFIRFGEGLLNRRIGNETPKAELAYNEGIVDEKWPVFIVSAIHEDRTLEILDTRLLPKKLINWRYVDGKNKRLEKGNFFIFSTDCFYKKRDGRIIFGLEDPKVERNGYSTRIERAWEIDPQSGHIKSISARNITCAVLGQ